MDDRYQVTQVTEETPFGQYLEAEDSFIQRKVQIFRFNAPTDGNEAEWHEAYSAAAAELGTASHPGLPIIYENGIDDDGPFAIRQLIETTSLNAYLVENGQLSEYEGWELAQQLLEIHDAAKESNNFHGSLDANHIGFTPRPSGEKRYSITDYGLAEIYNRMHQSKQFFGASYLISPEQSAGEAPSEQSQLYTIGQLIFHAISGGHPWTNVTVEDIPNQEPLEPINAYNETIPESMVEWLAKLIATDPSQRFSTYAEAYEALPGPTQSAPIPISVTAAVAQTPATFNQPTTSTVAITAAAHQTTGMVAEKQSNNKMPIIIGAAAVLLIGGIIAMMSGGDEEPKTPSNKGGSKAGVAIATPEGLIASFNFDTESLKSDTDGSLELEPLKMRANFAKKGLNSKGMSLKLGKNHFYRLSVGNTSLAGRDKDYSVSFWLMPTDSKESSITLLSDQPWESDNSHPVADGRHVWTPKGAPVYGNEWNMITMVFSAESSTVEVFIDGDSIGSSAALGDLTGSSSFIYIGCNSKHKSTQKNPVLIDNLSVWDKKLSNKEIKDIFYAQ